ncbi:GntR family transcriptional regulator [Chloroflexota bacterium]
MDTKQISIDDLPLQPADPSSPIPLYHQVETSLRQLIQEGKLEPGNVLPPEIELSQAFDVGRHTMRMALSRLADDGLISRKAGRGTLVLQQTDRAQFFLDRSFTHQMSDMGRIARSQILQTLSGEIHHQSPVVFHKNIGANYLYIMRLRYGDDEPVGLQKSTILTELCPGLDRFDFNQESLYDVLAREYKLLIHKITHSASATLADDLKAELLRIQENDPLLIVHTAAYLGNGAIIEHTTSYYRTDGYEYNTSDIYSPC